MKVTLNTADRSNSNFGMALFMPEKEAMARKIGEKPATQLEFARPSLETLADDVDIKVSPIKNKNPKLCGVEITVTKLIKSPIKRFFYLGKQPSTEVRLQEVGTLANFPDYVLRRTRNLKTGFIKYV